MRKLFVVDTENVSNYSFLKEYELTSKDSIILLTSKNSNNLSLLDFEMLYNSAATIVLEHVTVGTKNALDFQLIARVSIELNESTIIYIVSDDCGYDIFVDYVTKKLSSSVHIIKTVGKQKTTVTDNKEHVLNKIQELKKQSISSGDFHNKLIKEYGPDKGLKLYKEYK